MLDEPNTRVMINYPKEEFSEAGIIKDTYGHNKNPIITTNPYLMGFSRLKAHNK
jgi:hypothetical protein